MCIVFAFAGSYSLCMNNLLPLMHLTSLAVRLIATSVLILVSLFLFHSFFHPQNRLFCLETLFLPNAICKLTLAPVYMQS